MSYYGNTWNKPSTEDLDLSDRASPDQQQPQFGSLPQYGQQMPNQPPHGQQNQMPSQHWVGRDGPHGPHGPHIAANLQDRQKYYNEYLEKKGLPSISAEDMEIMKQCDKESFFYRCLPITAALCGGMMYTARTRQWQPKVWHYLGATVFGYVAGKFSYRRTCEEKLINSTSNSPFVNLIRKRRGLYTEDFAQANLPAADPSLMESDWTTPAKSYGIDEFDRDDNFSQPRNSFQKGPYGNRDYFDSVDPNVAPPPRSGTTYDDLRTRNRASVKA